MAWSGSASGLFILVDRSPFRRMTLMKLEAAIYERGKCAVANELPGARCGLLELHNANALTNTTLCVPNHPSDESAQRTAIIRRGTVMINCWFHAYRIFVKDCWLPATVSYQAPPCRVGPTPDLLSSLLFVFTSAPCLRGLSHAHQQHGQTSPTSLATLMPHAPGSISTAF